MEKFSISVNIAANSTVAFVLTYEELLQRKMGQYEILTRVTPKQPVQEFQVWHTLSNNRCVSLDELDPSLSLSLSVCVSLSMSLGQIVADIYEAQGLAFVEASATFLTNELLPLVKKTVADTKVRGVQK